jgi:hypothetical protein
MYQPTWKQLQLRHLSDTAIDHRIRRLAAAEGLHAFKGRGYRYGGLWFVADAHTNTLNSPEQGMSDEEAWKYLTHEEAA